MQTKTKKANNVDNLKDRIVIYDVFNFDKIDVDELYDRLWFEIYSPLTPLSKPDKLFMIEQINKVADFINKIATKEKVVSEGNKRVVNVTASMQWDNAKRENPNSKKPVYVECKIYTPAEQREVQPKQPKPSKAEKQSAMKKVPVDTTARTEVVTKMIGDAGPIAGKKSAKKKTTPAKVVKLKPAASDVVAPSGKKGDVIASLFASGKTKDEIIEITGFTRKACTDAIWRYEQTLKKSKTK